jgi:hypothetical protein
VDFVDPYTLEPVSASQPKASKLGLVPRVTSVIDAVLGANYMLQQYLKNTCILAAEVLPREDGEHDDDYLERVKTLASDDARKKARRGTAVHEGIKAFFRDGTLCADPAVCAAVDQIRELVKRCNASDPVAEKRLGGTTKRCSGQPDLFLPSANRDALLTICGKDVPFSSFAAREVRRVPVVIDLKTVDFKKFKKPYREHKYQLGGYGYLLDLGTDCLLVHWYFDPARGESRFLLLENPARWQAAFEYLLMAWEMETGHWQPDLY